MVYSNLIFIKNEKNHHRFIMKYEAKKKSEKKNLYPAPHLPQLAKNDEHDSGIIYELT